MTQCSIEIDALSTMQSIPESDKSEPAPAAPSGASEEAVKSEVKPLPREYGGRRDGLEPTRYGDWEKNGRCIDF